MSIFNVLDFEMNQPSDKIIQIGAVAIDMKDGKIKSEFNVFVNPHEEVSEFITKLTGITQSQVDSGLELEDAYTEFWKWTFGKKVIAWGSDGYRARQESQNLGVSYPSKLRLLNLKVMVELLREGFTGPGAGGLVPSLKLFGLKFKGRQHDALDDARNTAFLAYDIVRRFREHNEISKIIGGL